VNPPRVRAFVALELPEQVRGELARVIDITAGLPGKLALVPPEKLHLTLAFLGPREPERLERLGDALRVIARAHSGFELELGGPGVFPAPTRPSVLWIGLRQSPALHGLQAAVDAACRAHGWILEDRAFQAHLTCARVKFAGPSGALASAWQRIEVTPVRWRADSLSLMRSDSGPGGARYTAIARLPLPM